MTRESESIPAGPSAQEYICAGCQRRLRESDLISTSGRGGTKDAHLIEGSVPDYCGPVLLARPASSNPVATESTCDRCGGPNPGSWHAPSPLWNAVMRAEGVKEIGFCCPTCFVIVAAERGIESPNWHLQPDRIDLGALWTDGAGRAWDSEQCLWVSSPVADSSSTGLWRGYSVWNPPGQGETFAPAPASSQAGGDDVPTMSVEGARGSIIDAMFGASTVPRAGDGCEDLLDDFEAAVRADERAASPPPPPAIEAFLAALNRPFEYVHPDALAQRVFMYETRIDELRAIAGASATGAGQ